MKNIILASIASLPLLFSSCDGLLDKAPLDQIGNDSYWSTSKDLENYTLQFYTVFPSFSGGGAEGGYLGIFGWDANKGSDNMITTSPNDILNNSRSVVTSKGNGHWEWDKIRSVNFFFDNYSKCKDDINEYSHFLGEAYFFKAYLYFEKVKAYGDVPWFSKTLEMDSPELYAPRVPRTIVVDSILYCLDKSVEYLSPLSEAPGGSNRLSKETALLFKSRVALFEGTWQKYHKGTAFATANADPDKYFRAAVEAAEELMSPGKYSVGIYSTGNPDEDYAYLMGREDYKPIKEVLLWKDYDKGLNMAHNCLSYLTVGTNNAHVTLDLVSSYLTKNGRVYDYKQAGSQVKGSDYLSLIATECDSRLKQTIWIPGDVMWDNSQYGKNIFQKPYLDNSGEFMNTTGFQLRKGVDPLSDGSGAGFGGASQTGAIIFRYAEALLNYAEAKYELDGNVDYSKSINLLRQRAGMPDFSIPQNLSAIEKLDYGYPVSDELYEIRRERRVELAAEGFRSDDYRRWAAHQLFKGKRPKGYPFKADEWSQPIVTPVDNEGFMDPFQKSLPDGYKFNEKRDYLNCIPTNEITLNPELQQNPGW